MLPNKRTCIIFSLLILSSIFFTIVPGCVLSVDNIAEGNKLFNESKYQEALTYYDKAVGENPNNPDGWIKRGAALDKLQQYQKALDSISKGVSLNSSVCDMY